MRPTILVHGFRISSLKRSPTMLLFVLLLPLMAAVPLNPTLNNYILDIENGTLKNVEYNGDPTLELNLSSMNLQRLERTALDNVSSVKSLNLANNRIESLPEFMFSNLTNLECLNLSDNKLSNLENLFVGLEKLQILDISRNPVMYLRRGQLFGLTKSTTILTKGNVFWTISTETFTNSFLKYKEELKQLEANKSKADIEQKHNEEEYVVKEGKSWKSQWPQSQLKKNVAIPANLTLKLCMSDKIVRSIEPLEEGTKIAQGSSCLEVPIDWEERKVSLQGLGIEGFQEGWYQLQFLEIASLDLSHNDITEITRELLNDLPEDLTTVNLRENSIIVVHSQVIENRHLRELDLRNNQIGKIEEGALQKTNLTRLYVNGNELDSLSFVPSLPESLSELSVSYNHIPLIPDGVFSNLPRLERLDLANNNIRKLQADVFQGLESLKVLTVMDNSLMQVERKAFSNLKRLETLVLQGNLLTNLEKGMFAELESLNDLYLGWNKFQSLEPGSFKNVPRITLSLTGNRISSIPTGTFDLPTLRDLNLSNNNLTTIDSDSYEGLPQLKRLWLTNNQIVEIPRGSCKNLGSLNVLGISQNPFEKLTNGALYGLSMTRGIFLYIYQNQLKEIQGGVFDDV